MKTFSASLLRTDLFVRPTIDRFGATTAQHKSNAGHGRSGLHESCHCEPWHCGSEHSVSRRHVENGTNPFRKIRLSSSQAGGVSVAFNDGVEAKSALLNGSSAYALYWNTGVGRWAIAPYDEVAKRPSSLRAR
jgi:hypothetical protein